MNAARTPEIAPASSTDLPAVARLLEAHHLPTDDLASHVDSLWVARSDGRIVGSVALELYADGALLRSAAVDPAFKGQGLGRRLTEVALAAAGDRRLPAVYLLTTTAEDYFPRFGFERIAREDVPAAVRESVEFTSACPASAVVMRLRIRR
jgi:amino-acid N-acetyltransferase